MRAIAFAIGLLCSCYRSSSPESCSLTCNTATPCPNGLECDGERCRDPGTTCEVDAGVDADESNCFRESFTGPMIDETRWMVTTSVHSIAQVNDELEFTLAHNMDGFAAITSKALFDLTDSALEVELLQVVPMGGFVENDLKVSTPSSEYFCGVGGVPQKIVFGIDVIQSQVMFDPVAHRHCRIRFGSGEVFFETSPDGSSWQMQLTEQDVGTTGVGLKLDAFTFAGGANPSLPAPVRYDNFRVVTAACP